MLVKDVMSTDIVTCDVEADLRTAAERMLTAGVGSVVVTREETPYGILTETDALHAGAVTDRPFSEIPVKRIASHPLTTVQRGTTVRKAIEQMRKHDIKKLPVVEDFDVVGILTQSDISAHFRSFIREAQAREHPHTAWTSNDRSEDSE